MSHAARPGRPSSGPQPKGPSAQDMGQLTALFKGQHYPEALSLAQGLTTRFPKHGFGWKMLGVVLRRLGREPEALEPLRKAVLLAPGDAEVHNNLGVSLKALGRLQEASQSFEAAVQRMPGFVGAHYNLGNTLAGLGQLVQAELSYRRALQLKPDYADAHGQLAGVLQALGRPDEAISNYDRALGLGADQAALHYNLACSLQATGQLERAEAAYRRATQLAPAFALAHYNLGNLLHGLGRWVEAKDCYQTALQHDPGLAQAHTNLGNTLKELGRADEAELSYRQAVALKPDFAEAQHNLGLLLMQVGRPHEAFDSFRCAVQSAPNYAQAHKSLGDALKDLGQFDAAQASYQRALQIDPSLQAALSNLLFTLNYHPDKRGEDVFSAYRQYEQQFGQPHRASWRPHHNDRTPDRRLRIGYVSPALRQHSSRHFLEPLLAQHDHSLVEVYAYAELAREDAITARYMSYVDHWLPTQGLSDDALAQRIRDDRIDILVDVAGHTAGNRLQVFARKPAPVSLHWLDFGYTTGLSAIDYYLTDWPTVPAGSEPLFSEEPWRLDGPGLVYRPAEGMGETGPLPAQQKGHLTFGSLTRAVRINHHTVRVWSALLQQIPTARLVINSGDYRTAAMQDELAKRFEAHGIQRERLDIGHHSPPWDVLRQIDISLDCFPHNSGTTLFESLYLGVPFVTLAGRPSVGRMGSAILQGVGHPEWIAHSAAQYVEIAATLASDLPKLATLRAGLRAEMQARPLMDEAGFARRVEGAYRGMFERWITGQDKDKVDNPTTADIQALVALFTNGRYAEAATLAKPLTQRFAHHAFAWKMLAAALSRIGRHADALEPMQRAAALTPGDAEAHSNLGATFKALDRLHEAQASYQRALQINPDYAQAHYNLGNTLQALGQSEQAAASYRRALGLTPDYAPAHFNLGNALKAQGRLEEAERSYLQAVRIKPDHAQAWCNLGATLQALGRLHGAEASYRRALQVQPDYADAYCNLGNTLGDLGKMDEALASYQRALHIKPDHAEAHSNLLFALNYHPDQSGEAVFAVYRCFEAQFGLPHRSAWHVHDNDRNPQRRLRIGYVSPALRQHSSRHFLEPLLAQHDHNTVEIYAYAELAREDAVTARYKSYVDHWLPTQGLSDEALAQRIRDDRIDILVDVAGHTAGNRLQVFARKPAPVSLHWLDFGYTTGLSAIDYYLTDWPTVPAGSEPLFSETPWRLDGPGLVYRPAEGMGEVNPLPVAQTGHITFGSLTRAVRINHHTVRVWAELLKRVPNARLVINSGDYRTTAMQDELAKRFEAQGIQRERLDIGHHSPPWDVLRQIDISLDCFPHNSGTTLFESLYLGVPFVTLAGRPSVGRMGSAILHGLGHPEWIADSEAQYVEIAATLASDLPKLATLRASLRAEMQHSALMDEVGFARRVEGAYRGMFERWISAQAAGHAMRNCA